MWAYPTNVEQPFLYSHTKQLVCLVQWACVPVNGDTEEHQNTCEEVSQTHKSVVVNLRDSGVGEHWIDSSGDSGRDESGDDGEGTYSEGLQKLLVIQTEVHVISIINKKISDQND